MKIKFLKSVALENKRRRGVALLSLVCSIWFAVTPGGAQSPNQKRITALQLVAAAAGSRVTIVSDSALNDYEAFRRGDRFYVRIPLAESTSALPHCCADGFEDIQVQRVGDSLVVSFRLQPGATAHVDQRSNRLDVIFSAPNRSLRNNAANVASGSAAVGRAENPQTRQDRGRDSAGPIPPGSALAYRDRTTAASESDGNEGRAPQSARSQINPRIDSNRAAIRSGNNQSTTGNAAVKTPVPFPSSILTPSTSSSYPPLTTFTPASSSSKSADNSTRGLVNWQGRGKSALQWMSANRLATLLGALLLLSLVLYLATAFQRRRKSVAKPKRVKSKVQPRVQPKVPPTYSPDADENEVVSAGPVISGVSSNQRKELVSDYAPRPARAASAPSVAASSAHPWVITQPSIVSPTAGPDEYSSEEEEREVFEL